MPSPPSRAEFAQIVIDFLKAEGETRPMQLNEATFHLVCGAPTEVMSFAYLGHAYSEFCEANGENAARILRRRLWSMVRTEGPPNAETLSRCVVPRIRDLAWFAAVRRQAQIELGLEGEALEQLLLPYQPINEEMGVHLAFELPTSVTEITHETLKSWGSSFEVLYPKALENLRERSLEGFEESEPGVFVSPFRDSLDASRIVLVEDIAELPLKGAPVAIAPTHDTLFISGADDVKGLQAIANWAEEAILEPRSHSGVTFRLEAGVWKPWLPAPTHPAFAKLRLMQLQTLASAYARQKELLEAAYVGVDDPPFIATVRAFRSGTGAIFTACAWTEGVSALLPRTDRIDFVRLGPDGTTRDAKVWSTTYEAALQRLTGLMVATDEVPERWRVKGFPDEAVLEQLAEEGKLP